MDAVDCNDSSHGQRKGFPERHPLANQYKNLLCALHLLFSSAASKEYISGNLVTAQCEMGQKVLVGLPGAYKDYSNDLTN